MKYRLPLYDKTTFPRKDILFGICFTAIMAAAILLRLYHLGKYDLWFDELVTDSYTFKRLTSAAHWYGSSPGRFFLIKMLKSAYMAPYYSVVYGYSFLFGAGKSLRMLSLVFGVGVLPVFYAFSRFFLTREKSLYAVLLMGISPFCIWYAQEARGYTLYAFVSLSAVFFLIKAMRTGHRGAWTAFTVIGTIAVLFDPLTIFLIGASALFLLLAQYRSCVRPWLKSLAFIAGVPLFAVLVLLSLAGRFNITFQLSSFKDGLVWIAHPTLRTLADTFDVFHLGYSAPAMSYAIGMVVFGGTGLYGARACYQRDRNTAVMILCLIVFPLSMVYFCSWFVAPVYLIRRLLVVVPFYYLFLAEGIGNVKKRIVRSGILITMACLIFTSVQQYYRGQVRLYPNGTNYYRGIHQKKQYASLLRHFDAAFHDGDAVFSTSLLPSFIIYSYCKPWDPQGRYYNHGDIGTVLFYPEMLHFFERAYMKKDKLVKEFPLNAAGELYSWYPHIYRGRASGKRTFPGAVKPFEAGQDLPARFWLVSASWNEESLSASALQVRRHVLEWYSLLSGEKKDGVLIELYVKNSALRSMPMGPGN